ncbi:hypothetical protein FKM82_006418 [Ascaphus truei]
MCVSAGLIDALGGYMEVPLLQHCSPFLRRKSQAPAAGGGSCLGQNRSTPKTYEGPIQLHEFIKVAEARSDEEEDALVHVMV